MNKIELILKRDSEHKDVHLNEMSIEAAETVLSLLEHLTNIVKLTPEHEDVKIQLIPGSACVAASGKESIKLMRDELESVINNQSSNGDLVKEWRDIQSLICKNGLEYEVNFYDGTTRIRTQFLNPIKQAKKFSSKYVAKQYETSLKFISGKLIEVGGKKPNIHIDDHKPIKCDEDNAAIAAREYLYKYIRVSVWVREDENGEYSYEFCDTYPNQSIFQEFKEFVEQLQSVSLIEKLTLIHRYIKVNLIAGEFEKLAGFLNLWIHSSTDIQILKIILVITKDFRDHPILSAFIDKVSKQFDEQEKKFLKRSRTSNLN